MEDQINSDGKAFNGNWGAVLVAAFVVVAFFTIVILELFGL